MKIVSFAVNNFRGISGGLDANRIIFDNLNTIFIFGQNNVGKSTFLLAYDFFYNDAGATEGDFHNQDTTNTIEFELEVGIDAVDLAHIEKAQGKKLETFKTFISPLNTIKLRKTISATTEKGKFKPGKAEDFTRNPTTGEWVDTAFGSIGLSMVFQYLLPTPILIKAMPTETDVEQIINDILASKAKRKLSETELGELAEAKEKVKSLQDRMYPPVEIEKCKQQVNEHFSKLFPDVELDFEDSDKVKWTEDKFGKKFGVEFKKINEDGSRNSQVPSTYSTFGHGAVRCAIFSLFLMRDIAEEVERIDGRKEFLILFEEPELFLHPKIMRDLRELIYLIGGAEYPYQVLCASHSPQMIDLSKPNSSLIRMVKLENETNIFQVSDDDLKDAKSLKTKEELREEMFEVLRFNPHICESFYADEVVLIEGPTEEIIIRGILQKESTSKELFIVNCNSVNNIPFYQKIYTKFSIRFHVICDTDAAKTISTGEHNNPQFDSGIQRSISELFESNSSAGLLRVHDGTFEPAHQDSSVDKRLQYPTYNASDGKPFNANLYWKNVIEPNYLLEEITTVPIVRYVKEMLAHSWREE